MFDPIKAITVDGKPVIRFFTGWMNDFVHIRFQSLFYFTQAIEEVLNSSEVIERYFEQKNGLGFFVRDGDKIRLYFRSYETIINIVVAENDLKKVFKELKKSS